ncbi:MAG TPA: GNAT family N-acetyltransferase [Acidobacteriaceae bacterium]|nr:GNAT family N-acetyltransferase [Acidobacteriaceae bacterium]
MAKNETVRVSPLRETELGEAVRIVRLAFGTFLGLPDPMQFMGDRDLLTPRWRARNTKVLAAHIDGRLVGSNIITRWGSFGFFGPLTVLPEFWDHGVAQRLLEGTVKVLDGWKLRRCGLFTFAHSAKHVGLYNKFGFWPGHLTALMRHVPAADARASDSAAPDLLSTLKKNQREEAIRACARLTNGIDKGLDLSDEIRAVLAQGVGDVVMIDSRSKLDGFAVCMTGPGSEGGAKTCYVKFGAARGGNGADARFDRLLDAIDGFAVSRETEVEAGVNLARRDAYAQMRARGYKASTQGVAMHRPHGEGFNRADVFAMDDWR